MSLKAIDGQGNIAYHCPNKKCDKHESTGNMHTAHISHEEIQYTGPKVVSLPKCLCGEQNFLNVNLTEEDLLPHTEERLEQKLVPVKLEQLPAGTHQLLLKDGQYYLMMQQTVTKIVPAHPAIAHHIVLDAQLEAIGKCYTAPDALPQVKEQEATQASVEV